MRQTRREFVGTAAAFGAALGANLGPARAAGGPVRMSLTEFVKDDARLASFRKGVAAMKALPASDHRSWFWWAATHAYNEALYRDALKRDRRLAKVDRARYFNKCPHFGQCSADFIAWHRAYIYYFERTLRDAAQDASLALPYWDYSKPDARSFPDAFAHPFLDADKTVPNPLYHPNRDLGFTSGRFELASIVCEAAKTMAAPNFFSEPGNPGFGGDVLDKAHTQISLIEQRPHNDIHITVGGVVGSVNGAMADIKTSAFDPVFWVHHANIDRLWTVWAATPGKRWGTLPPDSWFDEEPYLFKDVDGRDVSESRRFYFDRANLDVRYDTDDASARPLMLPPPKVAMLAAAPIGASEKAMPMMTGGAEAAAPPPMAAAPRPTGGAAAPPDNGVPADMMAAMEDQLQLFADTAPILLTPQKPMTRAVAAAPRSAAPHPGTVAAPRAAANQLVLLELADISFERVPSSGFAVYLDPARGAPDNERDFVGLIDLFGATHNGMPGMPSMPVVQRFDVTRLVPAAGGDFTLRVEPYALLVSKSGAAAPSRPDGVKIGSVRFVVVS